ncbi:MAG: hypothetical protein KH198_00845, partial [Oscillibacter sp.]|nr:hypothetical protein [Oscillibacter sp.]
FQCELSAVPYHLDYFFSTIDEPSHCGEVSCLQHIFIDMMAVACCSTIVYPIAAAPHLDFPIFRA